MKLKLCRNIHSISLYKKYVFLLLLLMYFGCYGNLKFPLTCNGKNENWHDLLLSYCRYFGEKNQKYLNQTYNFSPNPTVSLVVMATGRLNLLKIFERINSSEFLRAIKLKLFRNVHSTYISLYKNIFYCRCLSLWLLWQFSFHRLLMGKIKFGFNCGLVVGILTEHCFEMFVVSSSTKSENVQIPHFDLLP